MTHRVTFYDLSAYGDHVLYSTNAPVVAVFEFATFDEAFEAVAAFGAEYQAAIEKVPA